MKKIKYLILLIISLLSGCYNYRELNDLAIATAISIDYKNDNFDVIVQIVNPVKPQDTTSAGEPNFIVYNSSAPTIQEALRKIILEAPRQLYGPQIEILVLSENVASNYMDEVLEYMTRETETRADFKVIIAKSSKSTEGIELQMPLSDLASSNILDSLELQSKKLGLTSEITLNDLTDMYLNPYQEIIMPSMIIKGNVEDGKKGENKEETEPEAKTFIDTTAIFKNNKLLGYLTYDESISLNFITGEIKSTLIRIDEEECHIVFEPSRIKSENKVEIKENKVKTSIKGYAKLKENTCIIDIDNPKEVEKLREKLNKKIEEMLLNTFNNIREEYNTDIFGFRNLYYKDDPNYFKKNYKDNWYESAFPNLKYEVESNIKLYEKGTTLGGIDYERKN